MRKEIFTMKKNIKNYLVMHLRPFITCLILIGLSFNAEAQPTTYYVTPTGAGTHSGTSWAEAKTFAEAVSAQVFGEMWLQAGNYDGSNQDLSGNMSIYGGFKGTETLRADRNPVQNVTIIQNCYNIGGQFISVLDGFTLKNSGLYSMKSASVTNCIFDNCRIQYNFGSYTINFTNCIFKNFNFNESTVNVYAGTGIFTRCLFKDNYNSSTSYSGGAVTINKIGTSPASGFFYECRFENNSTPNGWGGALVFINPQQNVVINSLFKNNSASYGGAVFEVENSNGGSNHFYSNNTFVGNNATYGSAIGFYLNNITPAFVNNVVWGNTGGGSWLYTSYISKACEGPLFSKNIIQSSIANADVKSTGPESVSYSAAINTVADPLLNPDFTLSACSPAINYGQSANFTVCTAPINPLAGRTTDLGGNTRIVSSNVDAGCFEWQGSDPVNATWYKDLDNDGYSDGTTLTVNSS